MRTHGLEHLADTARPRTPRGGVHAGIGAIAIYYRNVTYRRLVIERIEIGPDGKGLRAEGLYAIG